MKTLTRTLAAAASLGVLAAPLPAALAKSGDTLVRGTCTGNSSIKLKLSDENGRIEAEFEVDQNRNGVAWTYGLRRNGSVVATGRKVTHAPSGSWEARRVISNSAGADVVSVRATRASGEVCTARATF